MEILSLECRQIEGSPNLDGPPLLIAATPLPHGGGFDLKGRCRFDKKGLLGEPLSILRGLAMIGVHGQSEIAVAVNLVRASGRLVFDGDVATLDTSYVLHFHAIVGTGAFAGPLLVHCTSLQYVSNVVLLHVSR